MMKFIEFPPITKKINNWIEQVLNIELDGESLFSTESTWIDIMIQIKIRICSTDVQREILHHRIMIIDNESYSSLIDQISEI